MCGIIGVVLANESDAVNQQIYDGLTMLQHRGQDAAGMVVGSSDRKVHMHKSCGLVRDVFKLQHMIQLLGHYGVGHCRYPTSGASSNEQEAQPFVNIPFGLSIAHNGNLVNSHQLQQDLSHQYHFNTESDTEVIVVCVIDELLARQTRGQMPSTLPPLLAPENIFAAIRGLMKKAQGGYAVLLMVTGKGVVAFRDPNGIRPLCYGRRRTQRRSDNSPAWDYVVASESVAVESLGCELVRDVKPGEAIWFGLDGQVLNSMCHDEPALNPCIFEWVYFSRPDSVIDGVSVYHARQLMGNYLADRILKKQEEKKVDISEIDVVCPVPDTSRISALQCALRLGLPYEEGLTKNRYIARTFIMPGQAKRKTNVRKKLNPIRRVFEGKAVLLVDDSIVRGTTSSEIIQMCRDAGARKVFFCSASPPVRHPNVYGIDMPVQSELVAFGKEEDEIAAILGADLVVYGDQADTELSVTSLHPTGAITRMDCSCFTGKYVTGGIDEEYFEALKMRRNDGALTQEKGESRPSEQEAKDVKVSPLSSSLRKSLENGGLSPSSSPRRSSLPRGRMIAGVNKRASNSDYKILGDRLSGWQ